MRRLLLGNCSYFPWWDQGWVTFFVQGEALHTSPEAGHADLICNPPTRSVSLGLKTFTDAQYLAT
jgi:hypothetical protein